MKIPTKVLFGLYLANLILAIWIRNVPAILGWACACIESFKIMVCFEK